MAGPLRPRGASPGGRRKLPPKGGARRTASISLSRVLEKLHTALQEEQIEMRADHRAELLAIEERNYSGSWNNSDLVRANQILRNYVRARKK
jgi:hypothetical protein